jgi:hypothetical protein
MPLSPRSPVASSKFPLASRRARHALASLALLLAPLAAQPALASATTVGEQKTALLLVNFQDNTSQTITAADANTLMFGQVSDYYWEASYHHALISGNTYGWYTLPMPTTCSTRDISLAARQAAANAGVDLSPYSRVVIATPPNVSCGGAGQATVGGTEIFINGRFTVGVIAHEVGHSFGLMHSNDLNCDVTAIGDTCTVREYADSFDLMGNSANNGHFNAFQKERLGWLGAPGMPAIGTVQASGSFQIAPFETATADTKALRVLRGTDPATGARTWYYLEYRQPIGFDATIAKLTGTNISRGVLVHMVTEGDPRSSNLLDMTPNSTLAYDDRNDAALVVGQSFYDPGAGITITPRAADTSGILVDVVFAGSTSTCVRAAPTLTLAGPGTAVAAGSTVGYTVSIANRDSAACSATTFNLAGVVPSGWTGSLLASSLSLSPGASASTTLSVKSATTAAAGTYAVSVGDSSSIGAVHTASASASYAVATASTSLSDAVATDKASYRRGETVYMSAKVMAGGTPVAGANVAFTLALPGGGSNSFSATSGSDGFARSTYKLGSGKTAAGSYGLRADTTSGGASASSVTTFLAK